MPHQFGCGLLADAGGRIILGLSSYLGGGHQVIAHAIEQKFGPISTYLWGGELMLENLSHQMERGVAQRLNDTSGFMLSMRDEAGRVVSQNGLSELQRVVASRMLPFPVASDAQYIPFDPDRQHLDDELNELAQGENVRHRVKNWTCYVGMVLRTALQGMVPGLQDMVLRSALNRNEPIPNGDPLFKEDYMGVRKIAELIERDSPWIIGLSRLLLPKQDFISLEGEHLARVLSSLFKGVHIVDEQFNIANFGPEPVGRYDLFDLGP